MIAVPDIPLDIAARGRARDRGRRRKRRDLVALVACLAVLAAALLTSAVVVRRSAMQPPARHRAAAAVATPAAPAFSTGWLAQHPSPDLGVTAQAGIVVDLDSGQVLWARDEHGARAPASLTKLMTVLVALSLAPLDRQVTVPEEATRIEPDLMGLAAGDRVSLEDLMYGIFLDSGNDAAETLARTLVTRSRFIALMNKKAQELGLSSTYFVNPSGLDEPAQTSSAYDLAVLSRALVRAHPELAPIIATKEIWIPPTAEHRGYSAVNLNKLLRIYPGATGLKTGQTDDAGGCVVGTATRNGRHLLAVVLNSDVFFTDATRLLDYGFATQV